jgi:hypothetical protein
MIAGSLEAIGCCTPATRGTFFASSRLCAAVAQPLVIVKHAANSKTK